MPAQAIMAPLSVHSSGAGTTSTVPAPDTFKSDSVWTYELGEKWRTNDSKLTLNGAVYYSQWKDAQQFVGLHVPRRPRQAQIVPVQQRHAQQVESGDGPVQQGADDRLGG